MKILVILSRVPYPLEKGDKLRAFHQVRQLSKNHEVVLCCLTDEPVHPDAPARLSEIATEVNIIPLAKWRIYLNVLLQFIGNKPFQVAYFYQRGAHRQIHEIIKRVRPDHIYCQLVRTAEYAKDEFRIPKTLDYQDAFSKGMERRAQQSAGPKRWFFRTEARRLLRYEHIVFEYFDHKCIISQQDRDLIYHENRKDIAIIPNGVDLDFFRPAETEKHFDLCFVGNMGYAPNIDCALFLAKEIIPRIKTKKPDIRLLISGANPVPEVLKLQNDNIEIRGWVDDIRKSYAQSRIFIAPMQIGTGLQNKLLEAMAMKIPCITSKLANNALGATHGQHLLVGRTAEQYAEMVNDLLQNQSLAKQLAENAVEFVKENYSWEVSTQKLESLMQQP